MSDRVFFALWPEGVLRLRLDRTLPGLLGDFTGRLQRPDQWHVTLVFVGAVPPARQPALVAAAECLSAEPFEIVFDRLEHWRKPRICCLTARHTPAALLKLVQGLRERLALGGFDVDDREFRPHVTLARKVTAAPPPVSPLSEPVRWPVERFALVRSVTDPKGSRYEPLRWWNLASRAG